MLKAPCKDCEKRFLGCHTRCEAYTEYRNKKDDLNEARRKALRDEDEYWTFKNYGFRRRE